MRESITASLLVVRVAGVLQVVLGLAFWFGAVTSLVPVHIAIGVVFVVALWVLAFLAGRGGVGAGLVVLTAVWGLVIGGLGASQMDMLRGDYHWIVRAAHLVVGVIGIGFGEMLAARAKSASPQASQA